MRPNLELMRSSLRPIAAYECRLCNLRCISTIDKRQECYIRTVAAQDWLHLDSKIGCISTAALFFHNMMLSTRPICITSANSWNQGPFLHS